MVSSCLYFPLSAGHMLRFLIDFSISKNIIFSMTLQRCFLEKTYIPLWRRFGNSQAAVAETRCCAIWDVMLKGEQKIWPRVSVTFSVSVGFIVTYHYGLSQSPTPLTYTHTHWSTYPFTTPFTFFIFEKENQRKTFLILFPFNVFVASIKGFKDIGFLR